MNFLANLWDFFWFFLVMFAFFAWLMIVFSVFGDIFRDSKLGGLGKTLWSIFIIFLPFLGTFVYLIARGGGMAERQQAAMATAQAETNAYIRKAAGSGVTGELATAKDLLDSGAITKAEFTALKAKILKSK